MIKTVRACKKLVGGVICALGAGIFLYAVFPAWFMVILLAIAVILLGVGCFIL